MTTVSHTSKVKDVKKNFTADVIATYQCKAGKSQTIYWDAKTTGLGLRVTSTGAKSYIFETSLNNKTLRITIGDIRTYSIKAAQVEATNLKAMTDKGIDPRQVKADQIASDEAKAQAMKNEAAAKLIQDKHETLTLGMVWPLYIEARRKRWSEWSIRDHENIARVGGEKKIRGKGLTEDAPLASLLDVKLSELTGICIAEWLAKEAETRPTRAALAFRLLSVFINWCDSQSEYAGLVPSGACKAQQVRDEMPSKNTKEGDCLQREQLAPWFKAIREVSNPVLSAYLQSLLLTGARRRELSALQWADVDFQWLSMTIRDKVEGERTIPLTPYVAYLLAALPRRNEWVFSSPTSANGQIAEPTPAHKRALLNAGLPDLTLHGLRRSFGSLAEWTETPAGVVAQVMGHKPSAIAEKHYRRRPLDLLRMWHVKIEAWILEQAEIKFEPVKAGLHVVKTA
ncbi:phage integrase family protein [mine drainage metagenome]|uniref:Phage integrase family protein n=1 Tax=mine drainage metagenome TaxID=410659 RepID=A0A1J5RKB0_9ZZZZ